MSSTIDSKITQATTTTSTKATTTTLSATTSAKDTALASTILDAQASDVFEGAVIVSSGSSSEEIMDAVAQLYLPTIDSAVKKFQDYAFEKHFSTSEVIEIMTSFSELLTETDTAAIATRYEKFKTCVVEAFHAHDPKVASYESIPSHTMFDIANVFHENRGVEFLDNDDNVISAKSFKLAMERFITSTLEYDYLQDVGLERKIDHFVELLEKTHSPVDKFNAEQTTAITSILASFKNSPLAVQMLEELDTTQFNALIDNVVRLNQAYDNVGDVPSTAEKATIQGILQNLNNQLDNAFLINPVFRQRLFAAKVNFHLYADEQEMANLKLQHNLRENLQSLRDMMSSKHPLKHKPLHEITTHDLRLIMNNRASRAPDFPDLLFARTYLSLAMQGGAAKEEVLESIEDIAFWHDKIKNDVMTGGFSSEQDLLEASEILHASHIGLGRFARKSLARSLRAFSGEQLSEYNLRTLAGSHLGIKDAATIDLDTLTGNVRQFLQNSSSGTLISVLEKASITPEAVAELHNLRTERNARTQELKVVFEQMSAAQKVHRTFAEDVAAADKTRGETLGATTLYLQRMLSTSINEVTDNDLASIGATRADLADKDSMDAFIERQWGQNAPPKNWVTCLFIKHYQQVTGVDNVTMQTRFILSPARLHDYQSLVAERDSADIAKDIANLNIVRKNIAVNLSQGRSGTKDDEAGKIFKDLLAQYVSVLEGKPAAGSGQSFSINGQGFSTSSTDATVLRQAILSILKGSELNTISDAGHEKNISFINPLEAAQAALVFCHDNYKRIGSERLLDIMKKAFKDTKSADNIRQTLMEDFASITGSEDAKLREASASVFSFLKPLLTSRRFIRYVFPMALLHAQKACNAPSLKSLFDKKDNRHEALVNGFQTFTGNADSASMLAESAELIFDKLHPNTVAMLDYMGSTMLYVYSLSVRFMRHFDSTSAERKEIIKQVTQSDVEGILKALQPNTSISIAHTLDSQNLPLELGFSAGVGRRDGLVLTRINADTVSLSLSEAALVKFGLSVSAPIIEKIASASAGATYTYDREHGLVLTFKSDESCGKFLGDFVTNTATEESFKLCSQVSVYHSRGHKLNTTASAKAGYTLHSSSTNLDEEILDKVTALPGINEDTFKVDLLKVGANISAAFDTQLGRTVRKAVKNDRLITQTTTIATAKASATMFAGATLPIAVGEELVQAVAAKDFNTASEGSVRTLEGSVTVNASSVKLRAAFGAALKQSQTIITNLDETTLLRVKSATQRDFHAGQSKEHFVAYCRLIGILSNDFIDELWEKVPKDAEGKTKAFSLEVEHRLSDEALATLPDRVAQQDVDTLLEDMNNFYLRKVIIRTASAPLAREHDLSVVKRVIAGQKQTAVVIDSGMRK